MITTTSCSNNEKQKIIVQKLNDSGNYEDYKEITDAKKVSLAKDILHNVQWTLEKADVEGEADYRFVFQFINPKIEAKAVVYSVWISSNQGSLKVVQGETHYVYLNKKDSAKLFKVIIGNNQAVD